jgi:hypothetical protein
MTSKTGQLRFAAHRELFGHEGEAGGQRCVRPVHHCGQPSLPGNFREQSAPFKSPKRLLRQPIVTAAKAAAIQFANPVSTGNPSARHSGNPSSSRRTLNP